MSFDASWSERTAPCCQAPWRHSGRELLKVFVNDEPLLDETGHQVEMCVGSMADVMSAFIVEEVYSEDRKTGRRRDLTSLRARDARKDADRYDRYDRYVVPFRKNVDASGTPKPRRGEHR